MIERYSRPEMREIWSEENRFTLMLRVEVVWLEALASVKGIPAAEMRHFKSVAAQSLVEGSKKREEGTGHEIIGMLGEISARVAKKAPAVHRYLHYGLTSSDVLDTALGMQLRDTADLLLKGWRGVAAAMKTLAKKHEKTWMVGRTHGIHAEPMTFGLKVAGWHAEALRNIERMQRARDLIASGKLSGAVGGFAHITPKMEASVLAKLGLRCEPIATQVVPRDRHADYFHALVLSAAAIERVATEIRHLQRTEVQEVEEPFRDGQKGSSAMPHKRNPILCENLCGLSRLIRSYEGAVVENIVLWHERDISHSSTERIVLADGAILLDFMLARLKGVLEGLVVNPERMKKNMTAGLGLIYSQKVLLKVIDSGVPRLEAYDLVQKSAMKAFKTGKLFHDVLASDAAVTKRLSKKDLAACFDNESYGTAVRELLRRGGVL